MDFNTLHDVIETDIKSLKSMTEIERIKFVPEVMRDMSVLANTIGGHAFMFISWGDLHEALVTEASGGDHCFCNSSRGIS